MSEYVYGLLHGADINNRVITIKTKHKVNYYYMAKGLFQSFLQYFNPGIYVFLYVNSNSRRYHGYCVQNVESVEKIIAPNKQNPTIYYDVSVIKSGISSIVNSNRNKCFLDFEMSMPPYKSYESFVSEIIQVGYVLTDQFDQVISKADIYIKPKLFPKISERTKRFLHIEQEDVDAGIDYVTFYDEFTEQLLKYKPMVYVWGQNDKIELKNMNRIHELRDFTPTTQFIDLLKLHKTYYGLKNDLGLFNAYNLYREIDLEKQMHNAYEDAEITREVYLSFAKVCNNEIKLNIKELLEEN